MFVSARFSVLSLAALIFAGAPVGAADVLPPRFELSLSNDLLAGNQDDRYTAALTARVPIPTTHLRLDFSERMFTDRAAGQRFDESRLALVREGLGTGGWTVDMSMGVLQVGRGLLGESVQNAIHSLVGSDDVALDYLGDELFFEVGLRAVGPQLGVGRRLFLRPEVELAVAPEFSSHGVVRVVTTWSASPLLEVRLGLGLRGAHSRLDLLDSHLESSAAELSVGVTLFERVSLTWTDNSYGTGDDHIHVQWRWASGARSSR